MQDITSSFSYLFSFLWIVISCLYLYFWLPKKINFNYKKNLIVFFGGLSIILLIIYIIALSQNYLMVMVVGSALIGPWMGYFWAGLKKYLDSKKNNIQK